ncbi:MAG: hypothetical protein LC114_00310, partial [Bryobacterales bacterium]|nr:hypothetical protein [Bryobacterales bacterium]
PGLRVGVGSFPPANPTLHDPIVSSLIPAGDGPGGMDRERSRSRTEHVGHRHRIAPEPSLPVGGHGPGGIPS